MGATGLFSRMWHLALVSLSVHHWEKRRAKDCCKKKTKIRMLSWGWHLPMLKNSWHVLICFKCILFWQAGSATQCYCLKIVVWLLACMLMILVSLLIMLLCRSASRSPAGGVLSKENVNKIIYLEQCFRISLCFILFFKQHLYIITSNWRDQITSVSLICKRTLVLIICFLTIKKMFRLFNYE